jgi:hypothetical protein
MSCTKRTDRKLTAIFEALNKILEAVKPIRSQK